MLQRDVQFTLYINMNLDYHQSSDVSDDFIVIEDKFRKENQVQITIKRLHKGEKAKLSMFVLRRSVKQCSKII